MKKILALVLALVMTMALGLTALADGEIVNVMYGGGTPESMDPALNSASTGSNLIRLAFAGLMGTRVVDGVATSEPELAEKRAMILPPMAACTGISNWALGIFSFSFSQILRARG